MATLYIRNSLSYFISGFQFRHIHNDNVIILHFVTVTLYLEEHIRHREITKGSCHRIKDAYLGGN